MLKGKKRNIRQGDSKPGLMELRACPRPYEGKGLPFDHVSSKFIPSYWIELFMQPIVLKARFLIMGFKIFYIWIYLGEPHLSLPDGLVVTIDLSL